MSLNNDYIIREAVADEFPVLLDFTMQHLYMRNDILLKYFSCNKEKIDEEESKRIREDYKTKWKALIENFTSLVAVHQKTRRIAAMCVIALERNPDIEISEPDPDDKDYARIMATVPKTSHLFKKWINLLQDKVDESDDFFRKFPQVKYALEIIILCVDANHGRKGLATRLIEEAAEWAEQKKNVGIVKGRFSSPYSVRAAQKNDFQFFNEIDYKNVRDEHGNFMFPGCESCIVTTMMKVL